MFKVRWLVLSFLLVFICCLPVKKSDSEIGFDQHLNSGLNFMQQENYPLARKEFKLALNINPKSARVNNLMGLAYFHEQNYDLAELYFDKAVKLDLDFAVGYLNLGGVWAMKRLYPRAREYYEKALSLSPDLAGAYYSLGAICFQMGDPDSAFNYLTKGLELDPDYLEKHRLNLIGLPMKDSSLAELYFSFARIYASLEDLDRTVEHLNQARENGFRDWKRILEEKEFEKIRDHPRIREFLKQDN
jgi:tetratricopeptide (TPR) repeat protein